MYVCGRLFTICSKGVSMALARPELGTTMNGRAHDAFKLEDPADDFKIIAASRTICIIDKSMRLAALLK
jgi:hypothetical protein